MSQAEADPVRHQLMTHIKAWRGAGIEWMPAPAIVGHAPSVPASIAPEIAEGHVGSVSNVAVAAAVPVAALDIVEEDNARPGLPPPSPLPLSPAGRGVTVEERRTALDVLAGEVRGCTRCAELCSTRTQTVFGQGRVEPEVCFVGEAPGADEDAQGFPFVGAAGQLLNKIIAACGWQREEVYICNILKCRPPGNRTPLASEAANCRPFLERQLELIRPKYIVALGGCAATHLLQTTLSLGKLRGRFHDYRGIPVLVTYHPAFLLPHRSPGKKRDVWEDMKMLLTKMGRPIPRAGS